jgi:uncharacterized protein YyaL (SSP411 family)
LTSRPYYRRVAAETAGFLIRDLGTAQGGFASSLDADTDGVEGLTYVWTPAQLTEVLGAENGAWAAELFGVTPEGTFEEGASTLRLLRQPEDETRFELVRSSLLASRAGRAQPGRDDKVVAAWNGLAIEALAQAGAVFGESSWVSAAERAAALLVDLHLVDGRLRRTSRDGQVGSSAGVLEDYACVAAGLLALYQASGAERWLSVAVKLLDSALARFADSSAVGAFFDTADDAETLVHRPSDPSDNASPSGASALASALLTASALVGHERAGRYRDAAEQAVSRAGLLAARAPRFAGHWLGVAEALALGPVQVAVVGDSPELLAAAVGKAHGGAIVLAGAPDSSPLLADRPLVDGSAAAYVCRGYVCDRPATTVDDLVAALS